MRKINVQKGLKERKRVKTSLYLDSELFEKFKKAAQEVGYPSASEAVEVLLREALELLEKRK